MDNVQPTNVTSPASFAFRTEDRGTTGGVTVQTPVTLIDVGGTNGESLLSPANPLPVTTGTNGQGQSVENPTVGRVVGDPDGQFAGMDLLESVIDPNTGLTVQVAVKNPPLADSRGAQIPSDCAGPFLLRWSNNDSAPLLIDTTGYQTIVIQNPTFSTLTPSISNDGITFHPVAVYSIINFSNETSVLIGKGVFVCPTTARYFKLVSNRALATPALVYLRQTPFHRSTLVDNDGRTQSANILADNGNTQRQAGHIFDASLNVAAATVTDVSKEDGLRVVELLSQMLVEQRITNLYLYNLANNINQGLPETDDPFKLRSEPTAFSLN